MQNNFGSKITIGLLVGIQIVSSAVLANSKDLSLELGLPELYNYAKPLSQEEFDFFVNPIAELLKTECRPGRKIPAQHKEDLNNACALIPSLKYLRELSNTLKNPLASPIQFSHAVTNPHLEQVAAGSWKRKLDADLPQGQPTTAQEFATEVLLTKIIVQKSLLAYSNLSIFLSFDPNNNAKVYLVPKLNQSLEGRSLLGSLFVRYQNQHCSAEQVMKKIGSDLCQIEKTRLAAVIHTLYKKSSADISELFRLLTVMKAESANENLAQMTTLEPLSIILDETLNSPEGAANLWMLLEKKSSLWRVKILEAVTKVVASPIQIRNQEQVSSYVFISALLALRDIESMSAQVQMLTQDALEIMPNILSNSSMAKLEKISKKEISSMASGLSLYVESKVYEDGVQ